MDYTANTGARFSFSEWPQGDSPLECFDRGDWLKCLHGVMLCISLAEGSHVAFEGVCDDGVLHELVHLALGIDICTHNSMRKIRREVKKAQDDLKSLIGENK